MTAQSLCHTKVIKANKIEWSAKTPTSHPKNKGK